jgi:outer membrane protein assembly factor BamE (lipoprotein component of BamABCDE complex)
MKSEYFKRNRSCCWIAFGVASIVCLSLLVGCVAIPIPTEDAVTAGRPVSEEQLTFIKVGSTTNDEVLDQLGQPQIVWEPARVFVYEWDIRDGVLIWAIGGGYSGAAGITDIRERHVFLIKFDDSGHVYRFEIAERPIFQSYGDFLREWAAEPVNKTHGVHAR